MRPALHSASGDCAFIVESGTEPNKTVPNPHPVRNQTVRMTGKNMERSPGVPRGQSVDLVLTNGKRMVKALPMALPGASQGCRTLGYDRGGDKAPQTCSNGCREIVFGRDEPLFWCEPRGESVQPFASRKVMATRRVAHPPAACAKEVS